MTASAPPPTLARTLERNYTQFVEGEWERTCALRERLEGLQFAALATALVPLWAVVDFVLEPARVRAFGALRAADFAIGLAILAALRTTKELRKIRVLSTLKFFATGATVAIILPLVKDGYWPYLACFSLIFLGAGALFTLPVGPISAACAAIVTTAVIGQIVQPYERGLDELVGGAAYVATCVVVCVLLVRTRRKAQRSVFDAAFALEQRNDELRQALIALQRAQAEVGVAERHAAIGKLIQGVAHEVNNPLNVIANNIAPIEAYLGTLDGLLLAYRAAEPKLPDGGAALAGLRRDMEADFAAQDVRAAISELAEAAERIAGTYVDLVNFATAPARDADQDLGQALQQTFDLLRRALPSTLTIDARCSDLPAISARHSDLSSALVHVLQNASSAMNDRGTIRVRSAVRRGSVELSIEQLEPRAAARIAEMVGDSNADEAELRPSRDIIERYGGTLELDPSSLRGTKLLIRVPVRSYPPAAA